MEIHNEILENINTKYVLYNDGKKYSIINLQNNTMIIISDPFINLEKLLDAMLKKGVIVYDDITQIPKGEKKFASVDWNDQLIHKIFLKKIYNEDRKETGTILSAITKKFINVQEKHQIEKIMQRYAFSVLYPHEGLSIYSSIYNDTAAITVILNINSLPNIDTPSKDLYEW